MPPSLRPGYLKDDPAARNRSRLPWHTEHLAVTCSMRFLSLTLALVFALALHAQAQTDSVSTVMAGLSNHGRTPDRPYVTAGDRAYLIGTQDGNFPDMGGHVPGEMGGLWLHPIKLIDGFRATVS